jgi:hypothetical protein
MNISLIASIGISLVLCGAIVYYCNSRLHMVEVAIMRQNQVLSSFIANVQNEFKSGGSSEDLSTPEARASAEKIVVSDDSDNDDSSSESDTEDEETDDIEEINLTNFIQVAEDNIKIVDVQDLSVFVNDLGTSTIYEIDSESEETDDDSECDLVENKSLVIKIGNIIKVDNDDYTAVKIKIEPGQEHVEHVEEPDHVEDHVEEPEHTTSQAHAPLKHDQMRVDDLRKIVVDKQLSTKEEVKKLKKPELLVLLGSSAP